jgi:hypothetical protein
MRRLAVLAATVVLAGCGSSSSPGPLTVGAATKSAPPPPPVGALTLASSLRFDGVAVAVTDRARRFRVQVSVLGSQGYGVDGLRVRVAGAATTPCGHGCYAGTSPVTRTLHVDIGRGSLTFPLPRPPFRPGKTVLGQIDARYARARTAIFDERLSSGPGQTVTSTWQLAAPASLSYTASDDAKGVIIGERRWDKFGKAPWRESQQLPKLPQPALPWSHTPVNVMQLDPGRIAGRPVERVSFLDPTLPAWFTVSANPQTHELVRIDMVAAAHFMRDEYHGLDVPVNVRPPRG